MRQRERSRNGTGTARGAALAGLALAALVAGTLSPVTASARAAGPGHPAPVPGHLAAPAGSGTLRPATTALPGLPQLRARLGGVVRPGGAQEDFVRRVGDRLVLDGRTYRFAGSNNYYPYYSSPTMVDALFDKAAAERFDVMRVWGSREIGTVGGTDSVDPATNGFYLQYWDPQTGRPGFNDGANGLQGLDYVIASAKARGLRLVIPFVNNWNNFGGIDQYVRWAGKGFHDDFYTDPVIRGWYRAWVAHLLDHVNPLTGLAYKDDPTILMWELGNEPRCLGGGVYPQSSACTTDTLVGWADEMSRYVKSLDRRHLLGVGDEGFSAQDPGSTDYLRNGSQGVDNLRLSALPAIDVLGFHLYPNGWGRTADWGTAWITEHVRDAKALHKPAFLGEFGLLDKAVRNPVYRTWTDAFVRAGGTGELYWILSDVTDSGAPYADYDGFTVSCPSPVCTTLSNAGKLIRRERRTFPPVADDDTVTTEYATAVTVPVTANDTAYPPGAIAPATVDLDPATAGRQDTVTVPGGTATAASDGTVRFVPADGFSGRATFTYTVTDTLARRSGTATVTVVVKPNPTGVLTLYSFEDGTQGWAEQPWSPLGGTVAQTTDFATDGTHGLRVDSLNEWFGATPATPLDLRGKSVLRLDLRTLAAGTSLAVVLQTGPNSTWCQGPFVWHGADGTYPVEQDLLTGLSCEGGGAPDLSQVRGIQLFLNAGTFYLDDLRVQ